MPEHQDILEPLNQHTSLKEKLVKAHNTLKEVHPFIARISIAIYDAQTNTLKTFLHSSGDGESWYGERGAGQRHGVICQRGV